MFLGKLLFYMLETHFLSEKKMASDVLLFVLLWDKVIQTTMWLLPHRGLLYGAVGTALAAAG